MQSKEQECICNVWLVIGRTGGLGRDIEEALLESWDRLVATARDTKRLDDWVEKYGDRVRAVPLASDAGTGRLACVITGTLVTASIGISNPPMNSSQQCTR